jgi:uncharacterized protein YjbJ (UPF0337 family)
VARDVLNLWQFECSLYCWYQLIGHFEGANMNWDEVRAKWMLFKGSVKQEWAKFTDDDLDYIAGTRDRLIGRLEEKYVLG